LREALIVSAVEEVRGGASAAVEVTPADGHKCARCWKYLELGTDPAYPTLCAPCAETVRAIDAAA
jgi:hypothetical protein